MMARVRRVTPKERVLESRLGEGWEPLCAFLERAIPEVPFPRIDDNGSSHVGLVPATLPMNGVSAIQTTAVTSATGKAGVPVAGVDVKALMLRVEIHDTGTIIRTPSTLL